MDNIDIEEGEIVSNNYNNNFQSIPISNSNLLFTEESFEEDFRNVPPGFPVTINDDEFIYLRKNKTYKDYQITTPTGIKLYIKEE